MNKNGKNIVDHLAALLSFEDMTNEELETLIQRYPYFALAQVLSSRKLKEAEDPNTETQMQKAVLYFNNPLWFQYLITDSQLPLTISSNKIADSFDQNIEEPSQSNISNTDISSIKIEETTEEQVNDISLNEEDIVDESAEDHAKLSRLIEQYLSEFKRPIDDNGEVPIETRVYHAIDYFASQGIKLEPSQIKHDMFGVKVKKFTDWLKQIKQGNRNPTDLGTDIETEHLIEKIAQTSNETKDIVTETMAKVLLKQGKTEKAIQLYKKLSFLDPSKSTYFAAKINELKDSE